VRKNKNNRLRVAINSEVTALLLKILHLRLHCHTIVEPIHVCYGILFLNGTKLIHIWEWLIPIWDMTHSHVDMTHSYIGRETWVMSLESWVTSHASWVMSHSCVSAATLGCYRAHQPKSPVSHTKEPCNSTQEPCITHKSSHTSTQKSPATLGCSRARLQQSLLEIRALSPSCRTALQKTSVCIGCYRARPQKSPVSYKRALYPTKGGLLWRGFVCCIAIEPANEFMCAYTVFVRSFTGSIAIEPRKEHTKEHCILLLQKSPVSHQKARKRSPHLLCLSIGCYRATELVHQRGM